MNRDNLMFLPSYPLYLWKVSQLSRSIATAVSEENLDEDKYDIRD